MNSDRGVVLMSVSFYVRSSSLCFAANCQFICLCMPSLTAKNEHYRVRAYLSL